MCAAADPSSGLLSSAVATERRGAQTCVLRSPSRDSVATDLSLLSLSSLGSGMSKTLVPAVVKSSYRVSGDIEEEEPLPGEEPEVEPDNGEGPEEEPDDEEEDPLTARGQSPNPDSCGSARGGVGGSARGSRHNLQVPCEHYGFVGGRPKVAGLSETLFEEESDLIRSCGQLSSVLGLRRSFSTSDISQAVAGSSGSDPSDMMILKQSASEMLLTGGGACCGGRFRGGAEEEGGGRLEYASRSCSTWVAVGDMASTSQLPSPQGTHPGGGAGGMGGGAEITAAEFVRSVNKKVRQTYIKRRLLTTYKALERIAQSELNLQATSSGGPGCGCGSGPLAQTALAGCRISKTQVSREILRLLRKDFDPHGPGLLLGAAVKSLSLTVKDVEREKGKPLTKYERNMMIFNWLHTLEDTTFDRLA